MHYNYVNKVAKDILKNDTDAQDALQNAFTNAFKKLYQVKKYKAFKNWLHTIVRNEAIAIWEKNNKVDLIEDFQDELIQADDTLDRLNFYNMISILNIKEQKVFKLRYEDNLPIKHIAKILNTNENSIKSILRRGKAKLHEKLKPATLVFIFCIIIASTVLATCLINYIKDLFSINSIGANNDGVLMAIENLDWYQEIDMEYINLGNGYKLKIDYILMDEMNLYLIFNLISENDISEFNGFTLIDLSIQNENEEIICNKRSILSNQSVKKIGDKVISSDKHHLKSLIYMYADHMPIANSININFSKIMLSSKSIFSNNKYRKIYTNADFTIDLSEKFMNRTSTSYTSTNSMIIKKAIITETGFYAVLEIPYMKRLSKITLTDSQGKLYDCYATSLSYKDSGHIYEYIITSNFNNREEENLKLKIDKNEYFLTKDIYP